MNYRRAGACVGARRTWTLGIEPRQPVLQTGALPIELSPLRKQPAPPMGLEPMASCVTSRRSADLSYGGVYASSLVKELIPTTTAEGEGFEPSRPPFRRSPH